MATRRLHDQTTSSPNLHIKKLKKFVTALCQHSFSHLIFWQDYTKM